MIRTAESTYLGSRLNFFLRVDDSAKHRNMDEQEEDDNVCAEMLSFS